MKLVDIDAATADKGLIELARHLPARLSIGTVLAAAKPGAGIQYVTDIDGLQAVWFVDTGGIQRIIALSPGENEYTRFAWGEELERSIQYDHE